MGAESGGPRVAEEVGVVPVPGSRPGVAVPDAPAAPVDAAGAGLPSSDSGDVTELQRLLEREGLSSAFPSWREAMAAIHSYAAGRGFTVFKGNSKELGTKQWWDGAARLTIKGVDTPRPSYGRLEVKCSCSGAPTSKAGAGAANRRTATAKTGCGYTIILHQNSGDSLVRICSITPAHNHPLDTQEQHSLRPRVRTQPLSDPRLQAHLEMCVKLPRHVKVAVINAQLKAKAGELSVPANWTMADLRNKIRDLKPNYDIEEGDANHLLAMFADLSSKEPGFVSKAFVEDGALRRVLWFTPQQVSKLETFYILRHGGGGLDDPLPPACLVLAWSAPRACACLDHAPSFFQRPMRHRWCCCRSTTASCPSTSGSTPRSRPCSRPTGSSQLPTSCSSSART